MTRILYNQNAFFDWRDIGTSGLIEYHLGLGALTSEAYSMKEPGLKK